MFSVWAPIFALLIDRLPLRGRRWFIGTEVALAGLAVIVLLGPPIVEDVQGAILCLYPVFVMLFLWVFTDLCGYQRFSRALALSLMLGFLITELHELPGFIKLYLHQFDKVLAQPHYLVWFTPLNHIYSVIVAFLAARMARLKAGAWGPAALGFMGLWFFYPFYHFAIYVGPARFFLMAFLCRLFTFFIVLVVFAVWGRYP